MRNIAIMKNCSDTEKEQILKTLEKDDNVLFFDNEVELLESQESANIDVIFGEPEIDTVQKMKNLRWIQMTFAGANKYIAVADFSPNITLTSASGAYGFVISEYIISGILALTKKLNLYRMQMINGGFDKIPGDDTLEGKSVLILGTGNIGCETAKKLKIFGCTTIGICRTLKGKIEGFDEICTIDRLDDNLPNADIVIVTLPGTKETAGMFDKKRIAKMKKDAIFVNVGRGFIVNTDALTEALQNGFLKGAVLDVTEPEPLPKDHILRNMENVILTPHISGISWGDNKYTRKRILDIFCENLKRDSNKETKMNVIDFQKGY